jgi:hypothetical protein
MTEGGQLKTSCNPKPVMKQLEKWAISNPQIIRDEVGGNVLVSKRKNVVTPMPAMNGAELRPKHMDKAGVSSFGLNDR